MWNKRLKYYYCPEHKVKVLKKNTGTSIVGIPPSAVGLGKLESAFGPKTRGRIKMFLCELNTGTLSNKIF